MKGSAKYQELGTDEQVTVPARTLPTSPEGVVRAVLLGQRWDFERDGEVGNWLAPAFAHSVGHPGFGGVASARADVSADDDDGSDTHR